MAKQPARGIRPQEAMERLKKYQRLYDDKERKWETWPVQETTGIRGAANGFQVLDKPTDIEAFLLKKLFQVTINEW